MKKEIILVLSENFRRIKEQSQSKRELAPLRVFKIGANNPNSIYSF